MKELDILMKALEEKKIIKAMKVTISIVPLPDDSEDKQKELNSAIRAMLNNALDNDEDLLDKFGEYSFELGLESLVNELSKSVKPDGKTKDHIEEIKKFLREMLD